MAKISIYLDDHVAANGESNLYLRIYLEGAYLKINLDISVQPEHFDKVRKIIVGGAKIKDKNLRLKEAQGRASEIILKYQYSNRNLTKELFIKEFSNPDLVESFYSFMYNAIKSRHDIGDNTKDKQLSVLNKMKRFKAECMFTELNENYLTEYVKYLKKLKQKPNTILKDLKCITTYVHIAIKKELISRNPFTYFKFRGEKTYPTYLTLEERDTLVELYKSNRLTNMAKGCLRQFLFQCYTGLRISDVKNIRHENINKGLLSFIPVKTKDVLGTRIDLPLPPTALWLIKEENPTARQGLIFPKYVDVQVNKNLKEIAKVAKIDKKLSTHVGRHTFATLFLSKAKRANGILMLQQLLGHANIKSTMVYAHVITDDVEEAMRNFES